MPVDKCLYHVFQGLAEEQGLQLLAKSVRKPKDELPSQAATIVKLCHGSPMALDIIGTVDPR